MTHTTSLAALKQVLDTQGLAAGLALLNRRVPHRYTAVYQLNGQRLRRLGYVDKQGAESAELADMPFKDSFCEIAMREGSFVTDEPAADERLKGNPNRLLFGSYIGLPLSDAPGQLFGTFCHYDELGHPISDDEFAFLEQAARLLTPHCQRAALA